MSAGGGWSLDDIGVVATGGAFVVVASFPWYVATLGPGERVAFRAWDLGLPALFAVLLSLYAALRVVWLNVRPADPDAPLAPGVEPLASSLVAMLLVLYRSLDVPTVPVASDVGLTPWMIVAMALVLLQVVFAARTVRRTGLRQ